MKLLYFLFIRMGLKNSILILLVLSLHLNIFAQNEPKNNEVVTGMGFSRFTVGNSGDLKDSWGGFFEYIFRVHSDFSIGVGFESFREINDAEKLAFFPSLGLRLPSILGDDNKSSQALHVFLRYAFFDSKKHFLGAVGGIGVQFFKTSFVDVERFPIARDPETGELIPLGTQSQFNKVSEDAFGLIVGLQYGFHVNSILSLKLDLRTRTYSTNGGENYHTFTLGTAIKF